LPISSLIVNQTRLFELIPYRIFFSNDIQSLKKKTYFGGFGPDENIPVGENRVAIILQPNDMQFRYKISR
jgi:hypothetical protein